MLIRDTYNDKSIRHKITKQVGRKFSWMDRLKMGGVGSQRLQIIDASDNISDLLKIDRKRDVCNIEMRKGGIIVRFQSKMHTYAWTIPWYHLTLFRNADVLSIYSNASFIKVTTEHNERLNREFIMKVMQHKALWSEQHPSIDR